MLINKKFHGKCWYGRHAWIRLAMDCERMVEKGIKLFYVWEPPMIYLAWKVLGITQSFLLTGKVCLSKKFISQFKLWALTPLQIPTPLCEGPFFFYFMQLLFFTFQSPSSLIKHQLGSTIIILVHWMWLIFECVLWMDQWLSIWLWIAFFSVNILKDMVACWYAWVLKSSCQN